MVRKLGKYIVGETLGQGGYSKVKLGIHEVTGEKVALKILTRSKLSLNSTEKKQVEREIAAMKKVIHRNVIQLKFVDWDAQYEKKNGQMVDIILVVLELATGGELFEFLSFTGSFEEAVARTYFHQLIDGLSYCHEQGVVHRDLKPENLLLDDRFILKLADFGFSRIYDVHGDGRDKVMVTECGTTGYMAPEMFREFQGSRKGYDGTQSDVWACGVILFIMLAGFPPFQKPDRNDWWFHKLLTKKHALFWKAHTRSAKFSHAAMELLNAILNTDPESRITLNGIKQHEWYKGKTISEQELYTEFKKRKQTVDEENRKVKLAKQQRQEEGLEEYTVRDVDGGGSLSDDVLPPCPPSINLYLNPGEEQEAPKFLGSLDVSLDEKPELESTGDLPVYDSAVASYTRFESDSAPLDILKRIKEALDSMDGAQSSLRREEFKLKAQVPTKDSTVVLAAHVFKHPTVEGLSVVELRKRKGDSAQFRQIYAFVRNACDDIVVKKKA